MLLLGDVGLYFFFLNDRLLNSLLVNYLKHIISVLFFLDCGELFEKNLEALGHL